MIGNKLKQLRIKQQWTQEELAEKLFVTRNAVSKWETDKGIPSIQSLKDIAKVFHVTIDHLLSEEDLVLLTIENKRTLDLNRNLIFGMLLFFSFSLIGTALPAFVFSADPTSGIAVFLILLPISYILLGIFSVLSHVKWPYVVLSSALALTPIYVFFDIALTTVRLGYWGIIYYFLYIGSYFLFNKGASVHLKKSKLSSKNVWLVLAIVITLVYVLHTTYQAITYYRCEICSAPWYTPVVTHTIFYSIPLSMAYTLYFYIKSKEVSKET
jgi:transcriptional regulator with XRE-family HTH domain